MITDKAEFPLGQGLLGYGHNPSFLSQLQVHLFLHYSSEQNVSVALRRTLGAAIRKVSFSMWPFPELWSGMDLITSMKSSRQPPKVVTEE